ncbi:MAG: methyltransferase domain-containing protein, partial [Desulfobacula sp.]|nr:methyltransferase domain-containing protein [Desulfobacula sp.]
NLPMKNQEVNIVIMSMVLYHIFEPEKSIHEVFRVLKPGGLFLLADFEKHDQEKIKKIMGGSWLGFEKEKIKTWLIDTGFHLKKVESYPVNYGLTINVFTAKKQPFKEK